MCPHCSGSFGVDAFVAHLNGGGDFGPCANTRRCPQGCVGPSGSVRVFLVAQLQRHVSSECSRRPMACLVCSPAHRVAADVMHRHLELEVARNPASAVQLIYAQSLGKQTDVTPMSGQERKRSAELRAMHDAAAGSSANAPPMARASPQPASTKGASCSAESAAASSSHKRVRDEVESKQQSAGESGSKKARVPAHLSADVDATGVRTLAALLRLIQDNFMHPGPLKVRMMLGVMSGCDQSALLQEVSAHIKDDEIAGRKMDGIVRAIRYTNMVHLILRSAEQGVSAETAPAAAAAASSNPPPKNT